MIKRVLDPILDDLEKRKTLTFEEAYIARDRAGLSTAPPWRIGDEEHRQRSRAKLLPRMWRLPLRSGESLRREAGSIADPLAELAAILDAADFERADKPTRLWLAHAAQDHGVMLRDFERELMGLVKSNALSVDDADAMLARVKRKEKK